MKINSFIFILVATCICLASSDTFSQNRIINDCGTRTPIKPVRVQIDENYDQRNMTSFMMKIFVHIVADNNNTNIACGDSSILRQLENMQGFYAPHSICFQLLGIEIINDTDLNTQDADNEEGDLLPYLVSGAINIFVHWDLFDGDGGLNGIAYGIPNTYLSVSRNAITSITNRSTLAHEMGHCLGLYHTFETAYGEEEIQRTGECKNCSEAGDLLCDTEADPHSDSYDTGLVINSDCVYYGSITRECNNVELEYNMDPHNIMAYGRRSCREMFTSGQGARLNAIIATTPSLLNKVSPSSIVMNANSDTNITTGTFAHGAESSITVQGSDYEVSGSANGYFNASSIIIKPVVHFHPGTGGSCLVSVQNPTCD